MTSIHGTDSSYYSIANEHLYLNITDDKVGNAYYSDIMSIGGTDDDITAYSEKYNSKWNPSIFKAVENYDKDCQNGILTPIMKAEKRTTIYSIMKSIPSLKECSKLVDEAYFYNTLKDTNGLHKYTFFAFEDAGMEVANSFLKNYRYETYAIRELLKANTLFFPLNPSQVVKRKLKLKTLSDNNYIFADGRGKQMVIYIPDTRLNNYNMPNQDIVLPVKGYVETDNGWLYILEAPIIPQIII
jgi:hypothetical protein